MNKKSWSVAKSRAKQIKEGTHKCLASKHMRIEAYDALRTAWKQSGLTWDDFVLMLLNNQDDGK